MWDWAENQVILALIRHGETLANEERRYLGRTDEGLSERGKKALAEYRDENNYPSVDYLFSSPMKRCLETAEILYPALTPIVISEWREMDFGKLEYKNYAELKDEAWYQDWIDSGGALDFPEGESREDFLLRCERGFFKMCEELRERKRQEMKDSIRAGLIVHGGTIMALCSRYGGGDYFDYQVLNGRGYLCRMYGWGACVRIEEEAKL